MGGVDVGGGGGGIGTEGCGGAGCPCQVASALDYQSAPVLLRIRHDTSDRCRFQWWMG